MSETPVGLRFHYWGGSLLILSALLAGSPLPAPFDLPLARTLLIAAALLLLALGGGVSRNIFRGRPLGTTALLLLAGLILARAVLPSLIFGPAGGDPGLLTPLRESGVLLLQALDFITLITALIVAVQVARLPGLPPRWRWAPTWALGALALVGLITQTVFLAGSGALTLAAQNALLWGGLVNNVVAVFLGVLVLLWTHSDAITSREGDHRAGDPRAGQPPYAATGDGA
ncbi:hypothetical protein [Mycetocola spongiae]|uniref:hypothetical protein n=1 Tax=Mycetocola spongiae TaxID=2859226 RepID=UPI001CF46606|nr:hypothetical protein [Mycetocola spongiae]UCR88092.1 hypothetical protein KXZ72_08750 [Mycetocola spongiae]